MIGQPQAAAARAGRRCHDRGHGILRRFHPAVPPDGDVRPILQPGGTPTSLSFTVSDVQALPPDPAYRLILRVNGEQALDTPVLAWT